MKKSIRKFFPLFVLPTLLAFIISFLLPFIFGIALSFTEFTTITDAKWVGVQNYINAFKLDNNFLNALMFTVVFTLVSTILINLIAFLLSLLLTQGIKGTNVFRTVFFMPNLIGGIVLGFIWQIIINGILSYFHVDITFAAKYGFWGLIATMTWQMAGYMMIIYIAGLQNIPQDTLEAASIDGAGPLQTLFRVKIPMIMPSITICTFLTLTNSFKLFDQNLALTGGAPNNETTMMALDIYNTFYKRPGFEGVGQAKAVVFFLIVGTIAFIQLYATRTKEVEH